MKTGRSVLELAAELERQDSAKKDYVIEARDLSVQSNGHTDMVMREPFAVNEVAHGQIAEYLGIPKAFYDRMRNAAGELRVGRPGIVPEGMPPDMPLFDVVVNRLLSGKGEDRRMVRTLDGKARAFLSDTFNPDLDNYDVYVTAVKVLEEAGLCPEDVASCQVTDRRLYLKVVTPRLEAVIEPSNLHREHGGHHFLKEPQVVQAGFVLSNSETGLGSLNVQQVIFKLQCTNLWVTEEAYRQRHLGKALESDDDGKLYRSDTRQAEAKLRLMKIRDHVANALDEARFRATVAKMQETTTVRLEGSVEKVVDATARKVGLSVAERDETLRNLIEGGDLSLWGLTNAITATAQTVESYDRATELEGIGGRIFTLPKADVREIVTAK